MGVLPPSGGGGVGVGVGHLTALNVQNEFSRGLLFFLPELQNFLERAVECFLV